MADDPTPDDSGKSPDDSDTAKPKAADDPKPDSSTDDLDYWKTHSRKNEKAAKQALKRAEEAEEKLAESASANQSEQEKAIEAARKAAAKEARDEVTTEFRSRVLRSEIRAHAASEFADPDDAVGLLDLDHADVFDDDGEVDAKTIKSALADLLEQKPHLKADGAGKPQGDADAGRGAGSPQDPGQAHNDLILQLAGRKR